jgi:hypothetical protein
MDHTTWLTWASEVACVEWILSHEWCQRFVYYLLDGNSPTNTIGTGIGNSLKYRAAMPNSAMFSKLLGRVGS